MGVLIDASQRYGSLTGDVLVGVARQLKEQPHSWTHLVFESGRLTAIKHEVDPGLFRGRLELQVEADDDGEESSVLIDLRLVLCADLAADIRESPVQAIAQGWVFIAGDESFFIRYTKDLIAVIRYLEISV